MTALDALIRTLSAQERLVVAVSGGIDSTLLAHVAADVLGTGFRALHAVSPAVPASATERVRRHAQRGGWRLDLIETGEFDDPRYRANPVDRCYFCKQNLYSTIAWLTEGPVASGTNCDDLQDFRPGLTAASEQGVVHPYVDAGLGKRDIYAMARRLGMDDLAVLPAQPCLASRVETGLAIDAGDLAFVERVEAVLHARLGPGAVLRCRITHQGVIIELGETQPCDTQVNSAVAVVAELCRKNRRPFLGHRAYRRGAAFLREALT